MKATYTIILFMCLFLYSCDLFKNNDAVFPEAEIIDITDITDSSATFKILVTRESGALYDFGLGIWLDTIHINRREMPDDDIRYIQREALLGEIIFNTDSLKNATHYFARLYYAGNFPVDGERTALLGEEKEFTTLP